MVKLFWTICLLGCFAACGALLLHCGGQPVVVTTAAINCHHRLIAVADADASCNDRLIRVENIIATDPDCVAVYQGRSSGLTCVDHDGGEDGR